MGRWRPKTAQASQYITPAGAKRMQDELDQLWRDERPKVTQAVSAAAAQGDRSENAEYTYGKRRLREIDARVRFLRRRLDGMKIVDQLPSDPRRVFFGAWVTLEDDAGDEHRYRIVGPDEFDMAEGYISLDAPLARALMGKALDAEVRVELQGRTVTYIVTAIHYEPSQAPLPGAGPALPP